MLYTSLPVLKARDPITYHLCDTNSTAFNTNEFAAHVLISVLDDTTNNLHSVLRGMSNLLTDGPTLTHLNTTHTLDFNFMLCLG